MAIPEGTHRVWASILMSDRTPPFEHIGIRMVIVKLRLLLNRDKSPETLAKCCADLRAVFVANQQLPSVQRDVERLHVEKPH